MVVIPSRLGLSYGACANKTGRFKKVLNKGRLRNVTKHRDRKLKAKCLKNRKCTKKL